MVTGSGADAHDLATAFEAERPRLRAVAVRLLGRDADADDAVQDTWLRLQSLEPVRRAEIANLSAWLTTVVSRLCLHELRARSRRRDEPLSDSMADRLSDSMPGPDEQAEVAEDVALALSLMVANLTAPERVTLVLHDVFDVPFRDVAGILNRTDDSVRQLASRARRRVRLTPSRGTADREAQTVVEAFFAAGRQGDIFGLLAVLAPDVAMTVDVTRYGAPHLVHGAADVSARARAFSASARTVHHLVLNDRPAALVMENGRRVSFMVFTVVDGRVCVIDALADRARLGALDLRGAGL